MFIRNQKTCRHYDDLFEFIQMNKKLPEAIASLSMDVPEVAELLDAIKTCAYTSPIFQNDDVDLFLLYLIKEQKIHADSELNFWSGMSIYLYIMALRQYTDQLSVIPGDSKRVAEVEMTSFIHNGELTNKGEAYLAHLSTSLQGWNITLSVEEAKTFLLGLPSTEQRVIRLSSHKKFSKLLHTVAVNLPFFQVPDNQGVSSIKEFVIPSFSMMNYFLKLVSPQPLSIQPAFGRIGLDTLGVMHKEGVHHLPVSSLLVKSNLIKAHVETNAFAVCVHDILHAFMGSLLSVAERQFLFDHFVPRLKEWQEVADECDMKFGDHLDDMIEKCNDLDLSPTLEYQKHSERFEKYIYKHFTNAFYGDIYNYRNTFFLLVILAVFKSDVGKDEKYFWLRLMLDLHEKFHAKIMEEMAPFIGAILFLASNDGKALNELVLVDEQDPRMAGRDASLYFFHGDYMPFAEGMTVEKAVTELKAANIPVRWINYLLEQRVDMQQMAPTVSSSPLALFAVGATEQSLQPKDACGAQYRY